MCTHLSRSRLRCINQSFTREEVFTMIDWESDSWGGNIHFASNGSWVADRHDDDGHVE